jgi:AraC-like DNA-binding protein/mannose-6-phosphate isomerase-like protein (cupin superfamily)
LWFFVINIAYLELFLYTNSIWYRFKIILIREVILVKECSSCKEAMSVCEKTKRFAFAHLYNSEKTMNVHIHDCCEIYYSISGGKQFLIDNHFYTVADGDIFFINQFESHHLVQVDQQCHERIIIAVHPDYLKALSSTNTNLNDCFYNKKEQEPNRLHLTLEEQKRFTYFIHKLASTQTFGADLLDQAAFLELMVFLNHVYGIDGRMEICCSPNHHRTHVDDILSFINNNILSDLSIESLASHFYLSSSYLCRIFKSTTGTTINKYILAKRITISKALLSQGYSVLEACEDSGFHDYSNYLKAFTKAVGISPKKYAQFNS